MKMKNILALSLAVLLLASCLVGCGGGGGGKTDVKFNVDSLPIVDEPITLRVLCQEVSATSAAGSAANAGYWKWLSEKTGINFQIEAYSKDELANKLPLIMTNPKQMPDLFIGCNFDETMVIGYGNGGQLLKLNDLIEEYCPNIQYMFDNNPTALGASVIYDGSIYALPAMNSTPAKVTYSMNERFLANSGITETPKTLEALRDAMLIMRDSDANGNGTVGDEILWCAEPSSFKRQALSMVGIKCYWPWEGVIVDDKDDVVYFAPTSDEYKYLLGILHELYAAGCIDNEIFSQDYNSVVAKRDNDQLFMCSWVDDPELGDAWMGTSGWTWPEPLTSAVHDTPIISVGSDYQVAIGAVSKFTKYPEICALVLNFMYSKEASIVSQFGLEGVDYTVKTEDPWVIKSTDPNIVLGYGVTPVLAPRWVTTDVLQPKATALGNLIESNVQEYGTMGWQNYVHLTTAQAERLAELATDLGRHCDDYWAGFIKGTYSLETDWDAYVAACKQMKCDEIVSIYQAAYNTFFGK